MTLTTARAIVRQFARNGQDSTMYPDANIDRAILFVGNHFVRETRSTLTKSSVTITADDEDVDFSALTSFRPEFLDRVRVDVSADYTAANIPGDLTLTDLATIQDSIGRDETVGVPAAIGFVDYQNAKVWRIPEFAGTMSVWWHEPFTTFTAGTASPDSVTLNIPDDIAYEPLTLGATAILQHTEPQHAFASQSWQLYLTCVQRLKGKGKGNRGVRVFYRERDQFIAPKIEVQ